MKTTKSVKLSDALKKKGKSREFVKTMSDEEIYRRALRDLDNKPLTDEEISQFSPANQMDRMELKKEALRQALLKTGSFTDDEIKQAITNDPELRAPTLTKSTIGSRDKGR